MKNPCTNIQNFCLFGQMTTRNTERATKENEFEIETEGNENQE